MIETSAQASGPGGALARVVHDLHGPLTVIRGMCATLLRDEPRPDRRRAIGLIDAEALRVASGLRGIAHPAAPLGDGPGDLAAAASAAAARFDALARARGGRVVVRGRRGPAWVAADQHALERVLDNLLANALRHGTDDGTVVVGLSLRDGRAVVRVRDDGDGVAPGDRERIFMPGERGSSPRGAGRGLGLAIAREFAEAHGGRLTLDPVGLGACFRLTLPLVAAAVTGPQAA